MKIGIDARMYGVGFTGIGRYNVELIDDLAKSSSPHEFVIFLGKDAYDTFKEPDKRFKKVLADFKHYSFGEQVGFLKLINEQKVDLMHFTHFNAPIFYRKPYIVTIHDLTLSFFPGKKMNNFVHRMAYQWVIRSVTRGAKKIIAVSENTKKDLVKVLGLSKDKIQVIYNGINPKFGQVNVTPRADLMKKLGINKPFFLYTGVWRDHKNVVGMIKAFAAFNESIGKQYNLVVTGRHNPTYHEIPDTVAKLKLKDDVHLVGLVSEEDLAALYQNALCYVFPSFYEGFGLPPLEAMQCSLPVIASNTSCIPEICGEQNALFFDPYDLKDMEAKMKQITSDPTLRQRLIEKGLERVKDFDWAKMVKEVLEVYDDVLT